MLGAMRRLLGMGLLLGGPVFACGSDDRPPFVDSDERGGTTALPATGGSPPLAAEGGQGAEQPISGAGGNGEAGQDSSPAGNSGESSPEPVVSLTGDTFASEGVYVFGVLSEGLPSEYTALTHLGDVRTHIVSLGPLRFRNVSFNSIGVWKGRLTYIPDGTETLPTYGLTEFKPDGVDIEPKNYPAAPLANDVILDTPACPAAAQSQNGPQRFLVSPDSRMIYQCGAEANARWYEGEEQVLSGHDDLLAFGLEGLVAFPAPGGVSIGSLGSDESSDPLNLPIVTVRAYGDHFHAVMGFQAVGPYSLVSLDADGGYEVLGRYPDVPQGALSVALDGKDRLYVVYPAVGHYDVARATVGAIDSGDGGVVEVLLKGTENSAVNPTYVFSPQ